MAKTVDNFSTIEDFRKTYNELAFDVGEKDGLRDGLKLGTNGTLVDALNILEDKKFFIQEYTYIATNNQTTFTGNDNFSVKLLFKKDKVQVFKNERHLVEDVDYIVASPDGQGNHESIVLQGTYASGQSNAMSAGDRLTIYSYTGAFIGTQIAGTASSFFQKSAENTIYNTNANGVILNGDNSSATTILESGYKIQLAGATYGEENLTLASGKTMSAPTVTDGTATLTGGTLTATTLDISGNIDVDGTTNLDAVDIDGNVDMAGTLDVTGTTTVAGLFVANGNVDLGNAISDTISFGGTVDTNITPTTNDSGKVGISTRKWDEMHATDFHGNLTGNVTGNASTATALATARNISGVAFDGSANITLDTDDIGEGSSNLYFTNTRADTRADGRIGASALSALSDVNYSSSPTNGQILVWDGSNNYWEPAANANTTDSVTEGSTNHYFTDDRVNAVIVAGSGLAKAYVDNPDGGADTALDGQTTLSVNTSNGVKLDGDDVELDYSVITDSDLTSGLPSGSGKSVGHLYFLI